MLIPKVKNHQITILLPLKKIFLGAVVILFSFLQAEGKNDSIDGKNFERQTQGAEIYILDGTIISGVEGLSYSKIKIIKKDILESKVIAKSPLRKSQITKKEKSLSEKKIYKESFENKIVLSDKDQNEKYKYWLIEFQATKESGQYKYDFPLIILPVFLELLSLKKTKINFFSDSKSTFLPDEYCCIRPPPIYSI
jgi:hypothetical protein